MPLPSLLPCTIRLVITLCSFWARYFLNLALPVFHPWLELEVRLDLPGGHLSSHFSRWAPHVARSSGSGQMSSYFSSSVPWLPLPALLALATCILLVPPYPGRTHQMHCPHTWRNAPKKRPFKKATDSLEGG